MDLSSSKAASKHSTLSPQWTIDPLLFPTTPMIPQTSTLSWISSPHPGHVDIVTFPRVSRTLRMLFNLSCGLALYNCTHLLWSKT